MKKIKTNPAKYSEKNVQNLSGTVKDILCFCNKMLDKK